MANEDGERLDRLQRRDLQPRRAARASSRRAGTATARAATPRPSCTCYEEDGERCVERLRGHVRLRDLGPRAAPAAAGARPARHQAALLRAAPTASCLFASEIKAILAAGAARPRFNERGAPGVPRDALRGLGTRRSSAGVRKLLPGHTLCLVAGRGARARAATGGCRRPLDEAPPSGAGRIGPARPARGGGAQPPDERRAARGVPVRRHRLERPRRPHGADGAASRCGRSRSASTRRRPTSCAYARIAARAVGAEHREVVVSPGEFFGARCRGSSGTRTSRSRSPRACRSTSCRAWPAST